MKIYAARDEDAHQGWVWLQNPTFPARCIVKIKNLSNGLSIYCEALQIENNFLNKDNQPPRIYITDTASALVMGEWFRAALGGVQTQQEPSLLIEPCNSGLARFRACADHPQIVVRVAAWLGGIGLALGIVGFLISLISLYLALSTG